jgi:hypothetical protein
MSVVSEIAEHSNHAPPSPGGRRVRISAAVSIVLLCGGLGFVLGVIYPPEVVVSQWRVAIGEPASATMKPVEHAAAPQSPSTQRAPEELATAPFAAPPAEPRASLAEQSSPVLEPAPHTLVQDDALRPDPIATAEATATEQVQDAAMRKAEDVEEEVKKTEPRAREKRKTTRRARVIRAERRRNTARVAGPSNQPKGVISQIPIVGPVVGLIVPF